MSVQRSVRRDRWTFPEVLRSARGARDWTQADLAHAIGVGVATVGRWERGDTQPQQHLLRLIAEALELDEGHLRASFFDDVEVATVTRLTPVPKDAIQPTPDAAFEDPGAGGDAVSVGPVEQFTAVVMTGLARGDGTDARWSVNVANLARLLHIEWSWPPEP